MTNTFRGSRSGRPADPAGRGGDPAGRGGDGSEGDMAQRMPGPS
jgi:hypothetical protein